MLFAFYCFIGDRVVFAALVTQRSKQKSCRKYSYSAAGDVLFGDHPFFICFHDMLIGASAVEITAGFQRHGDRFCRFRCYFMAFMEVTDRPAVRDEMSFKSPVFPEQFHQSGVRAAGISVCAVVCTHDCLDAGFAYQGLKCGQISLRHIFCGRDCVELMTNSFRTAVNRKVLCAGCGLKGLAFSLQTSDKSLSHARRKIRILSVCFVAAAPSRITEDIDIWRPHRQSVIDIPVAFRRKDVVPGSGLC